MVLQPDNLTVSCWVLWLTRIAVCGTQVGPTDTVPPSKTFPTAAPASRVAVPLLKRSVALNYDLGMSSGPTVDKNTDSEPFPSISLVNEDDWEGAWKTVIEEPRAENGPNPEWPLADEKDMDNIGKAHIEDEQPETGLSPELPLSDEEDTRSAGKSPNEENHTDVETSLGLSLKDEDDGPSAENALADDEQASEPICSPPGRALRTTNFHTLLAPLFRSPLPQGHVRITWDCVSKQRSDVQPYADVFCSIAGRSSSLTFWILTMPQPSTLKLRYASQRQHVQSEVQWPVPVPAECQLYPLLSMPLRIKVPVRATQACHPPGYTQPVLELQGSPAVRRLQRSLRRVGQHTSSSV